MTPARDRARTFAASNSSHTEEYYQFIQMTSFENSVTLGLYFYQNSGYTGNCYPIIRAMKIK